MSTIEEMKIKKDVEGLIKAMMDGDSDTRMYASIALAEIGEVAVKPLIQVLKEGDEDVKWDAALALAKIGKSAVEPLKNALKDEDEKVRYYASIALGNMWLQGHDFREDTE
jgi:HEAT repeat protein